MFDQPKVSRNPQSPQWMSGGVNISVRSQTGLLSLLDTCHHISSMETCLLVFWAFAVGIQGYHRCPLAGIHSVCETLEGLHRLRNVTRAHIDIGVSSEWVKYQFWVKHPLFLSYLVLYFVINLTARQSPFDRAATTTAHSTMAGPLVKSVNMHRFRHTQYTFSHAVDFWSQYRRGSRTGPTVTVNSTRCCCKQFYQLILVVDTAVDAADSGGAKTEVKQRFLRGLFIHSCQRKHVHVCVRENKKK